MQRNERMGGWILVAAAVTMLLFAVSLGIGLLVQRGSGSVPVPREGLVAYWSLDEGVGSIARDASRFANHGRLEGPSWVTGVVQFGLNYYGRPGSITRVDDSDSLNLQQELTLASWICIKDRLVEGNDEESFFIFAKPNKGVYSLSIERNELKLQGTLSQAGQLSVVTAESSMPLDRWVHVAFSYSSDSGGDARLYIDGKLDAAGKLGSGLIDENQETLFIGSAGGSGVLPGIIDEVLIYKRALTDEEIAGLAAEAAPLDQTCSNCYAPPSVKEYVAELASQAVITQEQFLRWLFVLLNVSEELPMDASIEDIVAFMSGAGLIPAAFPVQLEAFISKGEASLLLVYALGLNRTLVDQLLAEGDLKKAEEAAFEVAFREGLILYGGPDDLISGQELAWMSLRLLEKLEISPPAGFPEWVKACAALKRSLLESPPVPPEPPSS